MSQTNIRANGVAVVSGANRGIGLQVARELGLGGMTVLMGARDAERGEAAAARLAGEGRDVRAVALDVTDQTSVDALGASLERVDVLVNNAAILPNGSATESTYEPPYSVSKAALNAITRVLAGELRGTGVLVNSVCPGWVRTDMGGSIAPRSVEEGAASVMWAVRLPDDGPTGGFFRDGEPVPW